MPFSVKGRLPPWRLILRHLLRESDAKIDIGAVLDVLRVVTIAQATRIVPAGGIDPEIIALRQAFPSPDRCRRRSAYRRPGYPPHRRGCARLAFPAARAAAVRLSSEGITGSALREKLAEVERYALGEYLVAIAGGLEQGGELASERVAEITGLPVDLVRRNFARIPTSLFAREFGRAKGNVLSAYDGTIETRDISPDSTRIESPDPILDRSVRVLTSTFVHYVRRELGFHTDLSYRVLRDYGTSPSRQGYTGVMNDLQKVRSLNPSLKVLIVHGYTDLVTPYMTSRYLVDQVPVIRAANSIRIDVRRRPHDVFRPMAKR